MGFAARLRTTFALLLALLVAGPEPSALAIEKDRLVPAGRLVIEGRRLSCGSTKTLLRDFEGFAVSSTVIMLNMQALNPLPRQVQWLIYYHECGHILLGQSETAADCYAVKRARREGCHAVLFKPFVGDDLIAEVRKAMGPPCGSSSSG